MRPDWNSIIENSDKNTYYFSMAEVPSSVKRDKINDFDYNRYLANYSNVIEVRRINYKNNPLFAIVFGFISNKEEIKRILAIKTEDYIS